MPIFILLVAMFLGLMVEVRTRAQVEAAVSLAAQSSIAAPVDDLTDSCSYAAETFYETLYDKTPPLPGGVLSSCQLAGPTDFVAAIPGVSGSAVSLISGGSGNPYGLACDGTQRSSGIFSPSSLGFSGTVSGGAGGSENSDFYTGVGYPLNLTDATGPPVVCVVTVQLDYSNTPLSFAFSLDPTRTFTMSSVAVPTTVRQCDPNLTVTQCHE